MFESQLENEEVGKKQIKLFQQKKKYKNLESDKKAFIDESVKIIKKQKTTVDKLKKQNQALKDLIAKMNKDKNQTVKTVMSETQLQKIEELKAAIKQEQENQVNIDKHIANFQKKITEKRKNCMGMNSGAESESNLQKQIKILENRLDKANQKFNETTAHNKELKHVIDSLRRERVIFDNLYKKLEKQLHEKRKKMADIIQKANNAYQERDKAHNQIQTLKMQAKKEAQEFQKQIKEISYLMEKIKLSEYAKKTDKLNESVAGNFYEDEQSQHLDKKNLKQTKKGTEQIEKIHKFREDFAKIEAATEIQNFDQLLRIFTENEEKNFQMFKFVNLQSNEIEQLESELFQLKKQLSKVKPEDDGEAQSGEGVSKQHFIEELQISLNNMKKNLEQTKNRYQKNQLQIRPLINYIDRIFDTIECDRELAKQMGGGNKAITQNNLLIFLAIIEHKSIKIVQSYKELSNPNMINTTSMFGQANKGQGMNMGMLTFQDFQDNEQYNKILTAEELREKAKLFIQKEQNQKQKKKETRPKKR